MVSVFDANHNSLWTWHIWCTDEPKVVSIKNTVNTLEKYHGLMDRNLGATYAPKTLDEAKNISAANATASLGLYYQYGRPIPFPGPKSITNIAAESSNNSSGVAKAFGTNTTQCEVMYGFKSNLQSFIHTNAGNSFSTMMAYPNIFGAVYYTDNTATGTSSTATNFHTFCKDFPMPSTVNEKHWYSENKDVVSKKGNNDPCPPGYCVDDFETFKSALYNVANNRISQGNDTSTNTYGYSYQCPTTNDVIWFPANGFRTQFGIYSSVGSFAFLWSARNFTKETLYGVRWSTSKKVDASSPFWTESRTELSWGAGIRCRVQDRSDLQEETENPDAKHQLSILFVGNSLTQDGIAYLPYMLKNYYPEIDFKIYMWYIGGKTLGNHYSTFTSSGTANIFSVAENSASWTNFNGNTTMADVLSTYKFDIVCMQEYFNYKTSYTNCADWNSCRNYIMNNYKGGNSLKFMSLFHAPLRKEGADADVHTVYERTKSGNAKILQETVSEDLIPFGIAVYKALSTDLNNLGDLGQLTPDGTHTQEGLPCLLQTYVALEWLFDKFDMDATVKGNEMRMTTAIYNSINVPGANLGSGVVTGTKEQYSLAQDIAIEAYQEGKEFLESNNR